MYGMFYTNRSAMQAQQNKLDLVSNNIANVGTVGYKRLSSTFQDLYTSSLERLGVPTSKNADTKLYIGTGVKSTNESRVKIQGSLTETKLSTDLAIDGKGLFKVYKQDGSVAYTRNGNFKVDAIGTLVDNNGYRLSITDGDGKEVNVPEGPINFSKDKFSIDPNGALSLDNDGYPIKIGDIKTYETIGDRDFISVGQSLFVPIKGATVLETTDRNIYQGFTEKSNVDVSTEMTDMIVAQRAFQLNSSALKTADDMWHMINNLR
ncbi:flagellar hook-basal body complex protein [Clostridium sp. UBA1056]|uniref:flagellar hook-basal body complex protein n=1 Tax=unclassified Clostridium TaxID=2614128 RepID=UPI003217D180